MAKKLASVAFNSILKKIEKSVKESIAKSTLKDVAEFATNLIVKRTRLGYGVDQELGQKKKLKKLSPKYIKSRSMFDGLSDLTTPKRSNLTRTSQMLDSIRGEVKGSKITIKPTGRRLDGKLNSDIARYNEMKSRIFMNISSLEFKQTVRFYRKTFGDLLRKIKVIE